MDRYCIAVLQTNVINVSNIQKQSYTTIQYRSISMMFWRGLVVFRFTQYNGICAWWAFHLLKFVIILYDVICAWWAFYLLMIQMFTKLRLVGVLSVKIWVSTGQYNYLAVLHGIYKQVMFHVCSQRVLSVLKMVWSFMCFAPFRSIWWNE